MPLLALLAKEPAHGYELKMLLEQIFGEAYPSPNIGQIYVTLQRLERDGLVASQDVVQQTRPNKRVYELTEAGRAALASATEPGVARLLIEGAILHLQADLDWLERCQEELV